jgi:polyphenol oxidase
VPDWSVVLADGRVARGRFSLRSDGDLSARSCDPDLLTVRRRRLVDHPWVGLHQVHGSDVVIAGGVPDEGSETPQADAMVTAATGLVVSVNTADCAPVALVSGEGVIGVVHAGWRGLVAGVVEAAAATMRDLGAGGIEARLGPCIHPECYEFGEGDLAAVVARYGPGVAGVTAEGRTALDLPYAVAAALGRAEVTLVDVDDRCTACDPDAFFSHRARADSGRHALAVWIDEAPRV